ncbi:restriction endonuclease subunit S [Ferrovum sp.]|uniref:restriction endonuclease subunit S n=1 Tax=Ferrovum sp. TaxID=2609467 RepID=UPI0026186833|nr:restriction endonuclease subunit S [Ferrovum sp.]
MKAGWAIKPLGEVCDVVNGGTPKTGIVEYWDGPHQWITPAEMGKRATPYIDKTERTITDAGLQNSSARLLPEQSVILSSRAPIGHLVINTAPMASNQGCKGLVPRNGLDSKYLYYYLASIVPLLNDLGTGATFKELSGGKLKEVLVSVAPFPEQHRIVAILDEAFDGIATAKGNAEKNLRNARALFESHLQSVFTERGEGWVVTTIDKISINLDSKRIPITKGVRKNGEYPYYGASGIVDYVADYIFDGDMLLISEDGANLLARSTPIAFSVSGKYWVNNHAHILKFDDMATQRFVEFYLASIRLDEYISGAAQPKLNQKALNSIPIHIPVTVEKRTEIVRRIESLRGETQFLESIYQQKLTALDDLKKSLLHQAFSREL